MVYHFTPFLKGNISEGINRSVELVPPGSWVCVRDADTMFLTWRQQWQIEKIAEATDYGLIGCMTNRTYSSYQMHGQKLSGDYDLLHHIRIAKEREQKHWLEVVPTGEGDPGGEGLLWGHFFLFQKETWEKAGGFSGQIDHDITFSRAVKGLGLKLGVALGLYLWHSFRPGVEVPWFMGNHDPNRLDPNS